MMGFSLNKNLREEIEILLNTEWKNSNVKKFDK